jgi:hypothetical protein
MELIPDTPDRILGVDLDVLETDDGDIVARTA